MMRAGTVLLLVGLLLLVWSRPTFPPPTSPDVLRVGTANLSAQNAHPREASRVLAEVNADVLLLQEWTGQNLPPSAFPQSELQVVLSDARRGTHGAALLAKPSIVEAARVVSPPWDGPCAMPIVTARIRVGNEVAGLLGVHGPPPVPACWSSRDPYLQSVSDLVENGRTAQRLGVLPPGLPALLLGDLNALGWELGVLHESGLSDAFDRGSWRLGPTWTPHAWLPALARIDHLWVPTRRPIDGAWTVALPGSDHRALLADLEKQ
jgi:endonuclease/exonuclease/phosphatase (EEP) superfamily protein YafD